MDASGRVRGRWLADSIHLVLVGARLYGSLRPLVAGKQRSHYSLSGPESGESRPDVSKYPSSSLLRSKLTFSPIGIDASRSRPPRP